MSEEELKECPFCGTLEVILAGTDTGYFAFCECCTCTLGPFYTRTSAVEAWNERTEGEDNGFLD